MHSNKTSISTKILEMTQCYQVTTQKLNHPHHKGNLIILMVLKFDLTLYFYGFMSNSHGNTAVG